MLSEKEKNILQELRKNSRQSFAKISQNLCVPITSVFETHKKLKKRIIKKQTSIINFHKTSFPITIIIAIKNNSEIKSFLETRIGINNLYKTSNGLLAEFLCPSQKEKHSFLEQINCLDINSKLYDLVEILKKEGFDVNRKL